MLLGLGGQWLGRDLAGGGMACMLEWRHFFHGNQQTAGETHRGHWNWFPDSNTVLGKGQHRLGMRASLTPTHTRRRRETQSEMHQKSRHPIAGVFPMRCCCWAVDSACRGTEATKCSVSHRVTVPGRSRGLPSHSRPSNLQLGAALYLVLWSGGGGGGGRHDMVLTGRGAIPSWRFHC